jgi:inorganic pyrophosphatase
MRLLLPLLILISACSDKVSNSQNTDDHVITAVIEIPAGTSKKIEYNYATKSFEIDIKDGVERIIQYLPYPGNYGFIKNTMMEKSKGGDGDALDVLVICESVPTGTIMPIIPIATLSLLDEGEVDDKVIAVPADAELNILGVSTFAELEAECPGCAEAIKSWFLNYSGDDMVFQGWYDETKTITELNRWKVE